MNDVAREATATTLEGMGELAGVDLENPSEVGDKLDSINQSLTNPENRKKMEEIARNAAEVGAIALEAAEPFTKPLIDQTVEAGGHALSQMGEAGVKVLLNTAEEIPGVGVVLGTVRSLSNIGEAILSSINAGAEVITSSSDSLNAAVKNFDRLIQEKGDVLERTKQSIVDFTGGKRGIPMKNKTRKQRTIFYGGKKMKRVKINTRRNKMYRY